MILGGSNVEVKRHNDYIINGNQPWTFPFVQYKKKPFKSFDLRDDIADKGISLKAIEGNLKLPIVESSVPFDIGRKLTPEELEEVIRYCKYDVDSTIRLYWERKKNYLDAKILAGDIYNINQYNSLGYTNARLSAEALEATYTERHDERDYIIPEKLPADLVPKVVLDFFMQIRDKSIPDAKLFGAGKGSKGMTLDFILKTGGGNCPVTVAWGGIHGAPPCITVESDDDYYLFMDDVGSLYPNSKINFGYCSRSMKDPDAYKKLVDLRLYYKAEAKKLNKEIAKILGGNWYSDYLEEDSEGDLIFNHEKAKSSTDEETYKKILVYMDYDAKQSSLKLIINTCYGAMLAVGNGLCDRLHGRSVCITNQICMLILITMLAEECKTIWFFNVNTDGIGYKIHKSEVEKADRIIKTWCEDITGFTMERTIFKKVIQKDVNNYIGITPDGKFKTKGGYVSLYKGGNFKTNSLSIVHKAIVDYLVKGIPAETTIKECKDIFAFQQIVKTGGTFEGSYRYVNGVREPIQKVNRIYAVKDPKYGAVVKGKWITEKRKKNKDTGKMESTPVDPPQWSETIISECPDHAFIDNENVLTVDDLDKDYYIEMAKRRIDKYINIDPTVARKIAKIEKEVVIMATETKVTDETLKEIRGLNVYGKLAVARGKFLKAPLKKSGVNKYAEFKYFELEDIVPTAINIFTDLGLVLIENITFENATAKLVNVDNPEEFVIFNAPAKDPNIENGTKMSAIQGLGAYITYMRRYLYMLVLDIVEADGVDAVIGKEEEKKTVAKKSTKPATVEEQEEAKKSFVNESGQASDTQIKAIKSGLKKLREKDEKYEPYIKETVKKIKSGMTKTEAEDCLIEIGDKIEE